MWDENNNNNSRYCGAPFRGAPCVRLGGWATRLFKSAQESAQGFALPPSFPVSFPFRFTRGRAIGPIGHGLIWLNSSIFLPVSHIGGFRIRINRSEGIELRSFSFGLGLPIDFVNDDAQLGQIFPSQARLIAPILLPDALCHGNVGMSADIWKPSHFTFGKT